MLNNNIKNFSKITRNIKYFDLLKLQNLYFKKFIDFNSNNKKKNTIYKILKNYFPIYNKKNKIKLKFLNYYVNIPKYTVKECIYKDITYNVNIEIKLKIIYKNKNYINNFYLCSCPYMTNNGSFIINGNERVVIYQINRSPGVFLNSYYDYNGVKLFYIRIIPELGSWLEIVNDSNNLIYIYIDKKKKFLITTFLRSIGYKTDEEIIEIFNIYKLKKIKKKGIKKLIGYKNVKNIYKKKKIILKKNKILDKYDILLLINNKIKKLYVYKKNYNKYNLNIILKIFKKDINKNYKDSIFHFYKIFKNSYPRNEKIAEKLVYNLFFNKKKYNLGKLFRSKLNLKFKIKNNLKYYLNKKDYKYIIKNFFLLLKNKILEDDIDNLSNRQVLTINNHLKNLFNLGLYRITNIIKEKNKFDINNKNFFLKLINSKILNSILNTFFCTSQVSQFLDKTNPLSEITHKRRLTLLGPGGLKKSRASFEARDVNNSHYGRLCPIETPEGPNIGLIYSLCLFTNINKYGVLETPYRKLINGKISKKLYFLSTDQEKNLNFGLTDILIYKKKKKKYLIRKNNKILTKKINNINYIDYSPNQILSLTASLIPFLEHNDANRALMGSNMMRQTLPLLNPDVPIVSTGLENKIIYFYKNYINAKFNGIVKYVDSSKIIIKYKYNKNKLNSNFNNIKYVHNIPKFQRTNQNTCFNLKPIVKKGDIIKKNQILCEGFCSKNGYLSLGKNLLVAFMSWKGYNYEDAIIVSNKILKEDTFTSLHINVFSSSIKKNKYKQEKFTRNIPNLNKKEKKKLNKYGIIKEGTKICPGDVIIGKVIPKENKLLTPEQKLLKYIFGNKASYYKDISVRAPSNLYGIVTKIKYFKYKEKNNINKIYSKFFKFYKKKIKKLYKIFFIKLFYFLKKKKIKKTLKINIIKNKKKRKIIYKKNSKIDKILLIYLYKKDIFFKKNILYFKKKQIKYIKLLIKNFNIYKNIYYNNYKKKNINFFLGDILPNNIIKMIKVYITQKRKLKVGDKMSGRHGNKGVISKIIREEDMPFLEDGTPIDIILNPLSVPSRMNLGQILESILGYIGYKKNKRFITPVFDGCKINKLYKLLKKNKINDFCKYKLYNGITGEMFDKKITIGVIYMLKLSHMVDDKMHARSIGPYSLITQQPLGGKSQLGGQRFGEMEVWALEAYGASNILKELLTIKSDDIKGRIKTYESIINNNNIPEHNIPESFKVLINELKGLCLNITIKKNVKKNYK
ncbi:MAG: DNA-directed RNA polymerase subunit beta [Candidatus Shikimatogenerans sp. JK-2022]|nr:DNA-directed RNA polymerase subunit beta [Candidatus Shikimatogenerans bostrichidophilus]